MKVVSNRLSDLAGGEETEINTGFVGSGWQVYHSNWLRVKAISDSGTENYNPDLSFFQIKVKQLRVFTKPVLWNTPLI